MLEGDCSPTNRRVYYTQGVKRCQEMKYPCCLKDRMSVD